VRIKDYQPCFSGLCSAAAAVWRALTAAAVTRQRAPGRDGAVPGLPGGPPLFRRAAPLGAAAGAAASTAGLPRGLQRTVTLAASAARNRPLGLVYVTVYSMGPESSAPCPSFGATV
jgi:hypothetical protein